MTIATNLQGDNQSLVNGLRQCRKCNRWMKPDDFYINNARSDGLDVFCKECRYEVNVEYRENAEETQLISVSRILLAYAGIPAVRTGTSADNRFDFLAWGCIPIWARVAHENKQGGYLWRFPSLILKNGMAGFAMLIACERDYVPFMTFIIPVNDDNLFYGNGRPKKTGLSIAIGSIHDNAKNWEQYKKYVDAFDRIERARKMYGLTLTNNPEMDHEEILDKIFFGIGVNRGE